ncbi:MAG: hypothetical protein Crog4KO_36390 [Crocinitomicaceae bacterium]
MVLDVNLIRDRGLIVAESRVNGVLVNEQHFQARVHKSFRPLTFVSVRREVYAYFILGRLEPTESWVGSGISINFGLKKKAKGLDKLFVIYLISYDASRTRKKMY